MPTLPLFTPPPHPDGWHRVTAPGGYESWNFIIRSNDERLLVMIGFHQGYPLHPRYVRRYALYRAMPTRFRPPLPAEYPCVSVSVAEMGRLTHEFANEYAPQEFEASSDRLNVRIGTNTAESLPEQEVRLRARVTCRRATVAADMIFRGESVEGELRLSEGKSMPFIGRGSRQHIVSTDRPITSRWLLWSSLLTAWWSPEVTRLRA